MANLLLGWNNEIDGTTLSGGNWEASLPLSNIQNIKLHRKARSSDLLNSSLEIKVTSPNEIGLRIVSLLATNLTVNAQVKVERYSDSSFVTSVFDSGWVDIVQSLYSSESGRMLWGIDPIWTGKPTQAQMNAYRKNAHVFLGTDTEIGKWWKISITDDGNPDGYVDVGRIFMDRGWILQYNYAYGARQGVQDDSLVDRSLGGTLIVDERTKRRTLFVNLQTMFEDEAYDQAFDMFMNKGKTGEILVIPDYESSRVYRTGFHARMQELNPLTARMYNVSSSSLSFVEI